MSRHYDALGDEIPRSEMLREAEGCGPALTPGPIPDVIREASRQLEELRERDRAWREARS